ncbi:MAG TPA: hypothetical protein DFI00_02315 [Rhodospirillaceae bacterium]|nr:hypothetical protein [Alphaproteobacteria bacterium]OUT39622.1 MAG: hypothetical protein CBB62_14770 [Micavibrio sp. TMED2]HCI46107.1 hypothetical protein [Rhodospirillaceae bacterium]MAS49015.1 hypothetical protein [Alphaproteobacteria bacterium]MAX97383.1 hypothetical protein [Alphaproteobacteria bacterium]|tara:strand:+ start:3178 stop:3768 length:591 start_codon:yes stop_codon:yes gene_type:complete
MAKKKAKQQKKKKGGKKKSGWLGKLSASQIALMISMVAAAVAFYPTTILLLAGMAPTIVAYWSDDGKNGLAPITVGALNLCGVMVPLMDLWISENSFDYALALVADPLNWLIMYSAAAAGWGVWYGVPALYASLSVSTAERRLKQLRQSRAELIQEWGAELNRIEVERRDAREAQEEVKRNREQAENMAAQRTAAA